MIKLRVNKKLSDVKFVSELNVLEYKQILENPIDMNIVSYISSILGEDISDKPIKSNVDLKAIESAVFDVDKDFTKLKAPKTFTCNNKTLILDENSLSNKAGYVYMYELYKDNPKYGIIDLCLYTIAILFSNDLDGNEHEKIYNDLIKMKWTEVLPVGFFFIKKLSKQRSITKLFYLTLKIKLYHQKKKLQLLWKSVEMKTIF